MTGLKSAVSEVGGAQATADLLNCSVQAVYFWLNGERRFPAGHCPAIERATGVSVEELRPDVRWHRVPDPHWPNPAGRPLIDVVAEVGNA